MPAASVPAFPHAALAAVVREDRPIAAAEFLLHPGQIAGRRRDRALGLHTVVADGHYIRSPVRDVLEPRAFLPLPGTATFSRVTL